MRGWDFFGRRCAASEIHTSTVDASYGSKEQDGLRLRLDFLSGTVFFQHQLPYTSDSRRFGSRATLILSLLAVGFLQSSCPTPSLDNRHQIW